MVQRDGPSTSESDARFGVSMKLVSTPPANPGIRNALRRAFSCEKETTAEFERLLAKLN